MTKVIGAHSRVEAWLRSTEYLLENRDTLNLILDIEAPSYEGEAGLTANEILDALYREEGELPLHSVAETIFPGWEYVHHGSQGVYERYPEQFRVLKKGDPRWGTYAQRLISPNDSGKGELNPLDRLVTKMRGIHQNSRAKYRSVYEISVAEHMQELALYDNATDAGRFRGGPCLMHLSFKLIEGNVHLTALYRHHDYRYKVPGNLLGLARLQAFVANEVGAGIGTLVVHSTLAYLDPRKGVRKLRNVISSIGEVVRAS